MASEQEHPQLHVGMDVIAMNGERVGRIKEIKEHDFLVDRPKRRDLYLPFSTIERVEDNQVILRMTEFELNYIASESPPIFGGPGGTYEKE